MMPVLMPSPLGLGSGGIAGQALFCVCPLPHRLVILSPPGAMREVPGSAQGDDIAGVVTIE